MAHFAELDNDNKVLRVVVVPDAEIIDSSGKESEELGKQFCEKLFGGGVWIQTSYSGSIRKNFASVGGVYSPERDAFIGEKPIETFVLDEVSCQWVPPVPKPADHPEYVWREIRQAWEAPKDLS